MDFRTTIKPLQYKGLINHVNTIVLMGSCFTDNIGLRLKYSLFNVDINPSGILYNPASISNAITNILTKRQYSADDIFLSQSDNQYHSYDYHSDFSGKSIPETLAKINTKQSNAYNNLSTASTLIITFGSAYIYALKSTGQVVANCHKQPTSLFNRRKLSVDEIVGMWDKTISEILNINPTINIIFTVSPIRHIAYGLHENQLSKSTLLLSIEQLCINHSNIIYFPSYEIMLDDLRDYRFYASDMLHPSPIAIDYIYNLFSESFFNEDTIKLSSECESLIKRLQHRHRTQDKSIIETFNTKTQEIIDKLISEHPYLSNSIDLIIQHEI